MTQTLERGQTAAPAGAPAVGAHRKDIEGLRALSILMIMVWHAGITFFPGGFVSLDVFFVISGFLITQLLVKELRTTGRLRLRRFYGRRAKRLLPAPTVVMVVTALLAWQLLPRTRWDSTAQDIIFTAIYGMNWRLAAQSVDYFQQDKAVSVLEHFWSLAVEEQFYILWPCLLAYTAARVYKRGKGGMGGALMAAFALIGVPSFAWSVYYSVAEPGPAYFATTTRAWEFAVGGALAMLTFTTWKLPKWAAIVAGWAGLATILVAAYLITTEFPYPSYWALIPCAATAVIILAGFTAGPAGPVAFLGTAPMQFVGRMSYSLYLCHWPAISLATAVAGHALSPVVGLVVVFGSAIPAYLLYRFVENPIRHSQTMFRNSAHMLKAAAVATAISLCAGMALHLANWPPAPPFVPPAVTKIAAGGGAVGGGAAGTAGTQSGATGDPEALAKARANPNAVLGAGILGDKPRGDQSGAPKDTYPQIVPGPLVAGDDYTQCTQTQQSAEVRSCAYGKRDSDTVVAVVGDSHANQWVPGLIEIATARGWKLVEYTKAACSFSDTLVVTKEGQPYHNCLEWSAAVLDRLLTTEKPTMVITTALKKGAWLDNQPVYSGPAIGAQAAGFRHYYEKLTGAGIPVVVITDSPKPTMDVPDCIEANPGKLTACASDRSVMLDQEHGVEQIEAVRGLDKVRMIDVNDAICPTEKCAPVIGNVLVYRDASHLTGTFVRTLVPRLDPLIGQLPQ